MKIEGVIIPPPEIRAVVDKTAQFVVRNGKGFEQKVLSSNDGKTAKFNFLKPYDPYNAYYEMKIRDIEDSGSKQIQAEEISTLTETWFEKASDYDKNKEDMKPFASTLSSSSLIGVMKTAVSNPLSRFSIASRLASMDKMVGSSTLDLRAPNEYEFCVCHPMELAHLEIDIIKATAQYTAVNGREFLGDLAQRERKNSQFDFLKPTHMLFIYFTSLVDSYARSLQPPKSLLDGLELETENTRCLSKALRRWEWINDERGNKGTGNKNICEEHNSLLINVDWYDFAIVETIPFARDELLSPNNWSREETDSSVELIDVIDDESSTINAKQGKVDENFLKISNNMMSDSNDRLNILKATNYVPRVVTASDTRSTNRMLDPISGCSVPVEQISSHMRIQLMDHKWNEQQKRFIDKQQDTGYAEGISISDSLKSFARQRGDIFGSGGLNEVDKCDHTYDNSWTEASDEERCAENNSVNFSYKRKRI